MDPVRFSYLKHMARSPMHYKASLAEPWDSKRSMEKGSGVHAVVLGGKEVVAYFAGKPRRGKEYDEFARLHAGKLIVTNSDYDHVMGMADAVHNHKDAMAVLEGVREHEVDWNFLGRACQSHLDCWGGYFITELKSGQTSHPDRFTWQAFRMDYPAQLAFYDEAMATPGQRLDHYIVAVEATAPYVVTVFQLTPRAIEKGRQRVRLWFERLLACERADEWPGYSQSIVQLDAPEEDPELIFGGDDPITEAA